MKPLSIEMSYSGHSSGSFRTVESWEPPVKMARVMRARAAMQRGRYDDPAILDAALDRLLGSGDLGLRW